MLLEAIGTAASVATVATSSLKAQREPRRDGAGRVAPGGGCLKLQGGNRTHRSDRGDADNCCRIGLPDSSSEWKRARNVGEARGKGASARVESAERLGFVSRKSRLGLAEVGWEETEASLGTERLLHTSLGKVCSTLTAPGFGAAGRFGRTR